MSSIKHMDTHIDENDKSDKGDEVTPFTVSGVASDEVTLTFDDGKELFVSSNFMALASPVFKAMFTSEFKEKESSMITLKGKQYGNILEFFLCLHPGVRKQVTESNVNEVLALAEEYQVLPTVNQCKNVLAEEIKQQLTRVEPDKPCLDGTASQRYTIADSVGNCLKILSTAELYTYADLKQSAVEAVSRFSSGIYLQSEKKFSKRTEECKQMFSQISRDTQHEVIYARLKKYEDNKYKQ